MATKVGAFKKDGTVQCVKLVEEAPTSLVSSFGGTISGGGIDLDNGYRLQFKSGSSWDTAVNKTTFPNNFVGLNIWIENNQFSTYGIWFSREGKTNRCTATFNESSYEDRAPIIWGDTEPIKMYFNELTIDEEASGGYDRSYFPLNSTYLAMYNRDNKLVFYYTFTGYDMNSIYGEYVTAEKIPYSDRWKTATVRMGKDGTLKCSKLIEETVTSNISSFDGVVINKVIQLNNGLKISVYRDGVLVGLQSASSINPAINLLISSSNPSGQVLHLSVTGNVVSATSQIVSNPWIDNKDYDISHVQVTASNASSSMTLVIEKGNRTFNYDKIYTSTSGALVILGTDSNHFNLSYGLRMKIPTVRVGKDGTIKCAKVQEATLVSNVSGWGGNSTSPISSGVITLHNGGSIKTGAYSIPSYDVEFIFKDSNYVGFLSILKSQNTVSTIGSNNVGTASENTTALNIWNSSDNVTVSEISLSYSESASFPSTLTITYNNKTYTYSLYPSSTNPLLKNYRPPNDSLVLSNSDRFSYSWE